MLVDPLSRLAKRSPDDALWKALEGYFAPLERKLRRAFQSALERARSSADSKKIAELINVGDYDRAVDLMLGARTGDTSMFLVLRTAVAEAAIDTARTIIAEGIGPVRPPNVTVQLDTLADEVIGSLRRDTMEMVTDVTNATRRGLKQALMEAVSQHKHPDEAARNMRDALGLTDRDAVALARYRDELERRSMAALRRQLRDRRFDGLIRRKEELTRAKIESIVQRYRERLIAARAEAVARTEAARAFNLGQQLIWQEAARDALIDPRFIRRFWKVAPGERTCEVCRAIAAGHSDGVGLTESFVLPNGAALVPPAHPRCRCVIVVRVMIPER